MNRTRELVVLLLAIFVAVILGLKIASDEETFSVAEESVTASVSAAPTSESVVEAPTCEDVDGAVTVGVSDASPRGSVTRDSQSVVLAMFQLSAIGKTVEVKELTFAVDSSVDSFKGLVNASVFYGGEQIGQTLDLYEGTTFSFYPPLIVQAETTVVISVHADIAERKGNITSGSTIQVKLMPGSSNVVGQDSCATYSIPVVSFRAFTLTVR